MSLTSVSCSDLGCLEQADVVKTFLGLIIIHAMRLTGRSFYIAKVDADLLHEYNEDRDVKFEAGLHSNKLHNSIFFMAIVYTIRYYMYAGVGDVTRPTKKWLDFGVAQIR